MTSHRSILLTLWFLSCLLPTGLSTTTSTTSTSEQLFWTQNLPDPDPELTATVTLAARISTSNSSPVPTTTPNSGSCNATSITCPACNDAYVADSQNHSYHIFCDDKLYSDSPFPVQRWLSPSGCLDECHDYPWCKGATSWGEGNCQLARGENVFPQGAEDRIAMLRIPDGYVAPSPATVPSAFPTGDIPLPTPSSRAPSGKPGKCNLRDIECPYSRGQTITDGYNAAYTVRCSFQPLCRSFLSVEGRQSKCSCLAHCDRDAGCLAALFHRGRCDLCHGRLEGLSTYTSPRHYIVFVSETPEVETVTTSSISLSTVTGTSSSRSRLPPTSISIPRPSSTSKRPTRIPSSSRHSASTTSTRQSSSTPRTSASRRTSISTLSGRRESSSTASGLPGTISTRRTTMTVRPSSTSRSSARFQGTTTPANSASTRSSTSRTTGPPFASPRSSSTARRLSTSSASQLRSTSPSAATTHFASGTAPSPIITVLPWPQNPARLPPIASAACPAWDSENVFSPDQDRNYIIQCDASFDAAVTHMTSAVDFVACAEECAGECGGVVFSEVREGAGGEGASDGGRRGGGEGCTLFTGISVIESRAGATAGVWVRFPGTVRASLITATNEAVLTEAPDAMMSAILAVSPWAGVVPSLAAEERQQKN